MIRRLEDCWIKKNLKEVALLIGVEGEVLLIIRDLIKKDLVKVQWKWKKEFKIKMIGFLEDLTKLNGVGDLVTPISVALEDLNQAGGVEETLTRVEVEEAQVDGVKNLLMQVDKLREVLIEVGEAENPLAKMNKIEVT